MKKKKEKKMYYMERRRRLGAQKETKNLMKAMKFLTFPNGISGFQS